MKIWISLVGLIAAAALLAAAADPNPNASGGTLRVLEPYPVLDIDPAQAGGTNAFQIDYATCLKLVNYRDAGGARSTELVGEAAKLPHISRDRRTYDFDVKAGFTRFSSGERVTARTFAKTIERVLDPATGSAGQTYLADVVGAKEWISGRSPKISGLQVLGSHLRIRLKAPAGDFLSRLALPFFCAVPANLAHGYLNVTNLPGAGPYYVDFWDPRAQTEPIILKRNPYYHGPRPHRLASIRFELSSDPNRDFDRIESGEFDLLPLFYATPAALDERFAQSPLARVHSWTAIRYLLFDSRPGSAFANPALRRAVAIALDRKELAALAGRRRALPIDHFLPPALPGSRRQTVYAHTPTEADLARARRPVAPYLPLSVTLGPARSGTRRGKSCNRSRESGSASRTAPAQPGIASTT